METPNTLARGELLDFLSSRSHRLISWPVTTNTSWNPQPFPWQSYRVFNGVHESTSRHVQFMSFFNSSSPLFDPLLWDPPDNLCLKAKKTTLELKSSCDDVKTLQEIISKLAETKLLSSSKFVQRKSRNISIWSGPNDAQRYQSRVEWKIKTFLRRTLVKPHSKPWSNLRTCTSRHPPGLQVRGRA